MNNILTLNTHTRTSAYQYRLQDSHKAYNPKSNPSKRRTVYG